MTPLGKSGKIITRLMAAVVLIAVLWVVGDRLNHWYRKQWHFVAWMQDLPPVDRSNWPKPPAAWSNVTVDVRAVMPEGFKSIKVTYAVNSIGMKLVRIEPGTL